MCLNTRDNSDIHVFLGFEKKMSGEKQNLRFFHQTGKKYFSGTNKVLCFFVFFNFQEKIKIVNET